MNEPTPEDLAQADADARWDDVRRAIPGVAQLEDLLAAEVTFSPDGDSEGGANGFFFAHVTAPWGNESSRKAHASYELAVLDLFDVVRSFVASELAEARRPET